MDDAAKSLIKTEIIPLIEQGRCTLYIGAGFSIGVPTLADSLVPSTGELIERILSRLNYTPEEIKEADLGDAFGNGKDGIPDFDNFLAENFKIKAPFDWQLELLNFWWRAIFTTNVDDTLKKAAAILQNRPGRDGPDYVFYNYNDRAPIERNPIEIPMVTLHGDIDRTREGLVFDDIEYADVTVRQNDWSRLAALHLSHGHCILIGSKFKEPDIEAALRERVLFDDDDGFSYPNWIVLRSIDRAKRERFESRNIHPIICEAEEFCKFIVENTNALTGTKFLRRYAPHLSMENKDAGGWFVKSFENVTDELAKAARAKPVFSRFFSGDGPNWTYIYNDVPARFGVVDQIISSVKKVQNEKKKACVISVVGGVATGKTTSCMMALRELSEANIAIYTFNQIEGVDIEALWSALKDAKGLIVLYFSNSSDSFVNIDAVIKRLLDRDHGANVVFLLEERTLEFNKNKRHLKSITRQDISYFELTTVSPDEAKALYDKLIEYGMKTGPLEKKSPEEAIRLILDKDRGFRGDLLGTLCEVTSHESFAHKIREEYIGFESEKSREVFETICVASSARMDLPVPYLAEMHGLRINSILNLVQSELAGKILVRNERVSTRHYGIAEYIVKNLINSDYLAESIVRIAKCLSTKFTIQDIPRHPFAYRLYKNILSYRFLTYNIQSEDRFDVIESIYSQCQRYYSEDGIFWLQYGRFLEKFGKFDDSIHCLRKGLGLYDSFQLRHAIGDVLIRAFIAGGGSGHKLLEEGTEFLDIELAARGLDDSYVPTTYVDRLMDVYEVTQDPAYLEKVRQILNDYMRVYPDDERFKNMIVRFTRMHTSSGGSI